MTPLVSATPTAPTSSRSCICTVCQISWLLILCNNRSISSN
jgi:hypothetical protein